MPARSLLFVLGLLLALICIFFVRNVFGAITGLGLAAALMLAALYLRGIWSEGLLLVLALQALLDGFGSVIDLFWISTRSDVHTDAHTLAQLTGLPAPVWAVIWGLLSATLALIALRIAYRAKPTSAPDTEFARSQQRSA